MTTTKANWKNDTERVRTMMLEIEKIGGSKPWVARITGTDPKYGLARTFVAGVADYSRSNRPGTRGVFFAFDLDDGIYEIKGGDSWGSADNRKFCRVVGDKMERLTRQEVLNEIHAGEVGAA